MSKPQTMEISMPSNDKTLTEQERDKVAASRAITLILGGNNRVYYYTGEPNYEDWTSLQETTYNDDGLRAMLLYRNQEVVSKIRELKKEKIDTKMHICSINKYAIVDIAEGDEWLVENYEKKGELTNQIDRDQM